MNHTYHIETKAHKTAQERGQTWWLFAIMVSLLALQTQILDFHRTTHLVLDVTIGHTYLMQYDFKSNTLSEMGSGKCRKYQRFYQRQHSAFAKMVTNSFGVFYDNVDRTFCNSYRTLLTNMHKQCLDFLKMKTPLSLQHPLPSRQQSWANYRKLPGLKYNTKEFRHFSSKEENWHFSSSSKIKLLSLHLDTRFRPTGTPTRGRRRHLESSTSQLLSPAPTSTLTNACITFSIYPYHCPPLPLMILPNFVH